MNAAPAWTCIKRRWWGVCGCASGHVQREVRRWGTTTAELLKLAVWLRQAGCTHIAMEGSGVYWKPVGTCWKVSSNCFWLTRRRRIHDRALAYMEAKVVNIRFIGDAISVGGYCAEARSAGWPLICHHCGDREAVIAGIVAADLIEEAWLLCTRCIREQISERIVH